MEEIQTLNLASKGSLSRTDSIVMSPGLQRSQKGKLTLMFLMNIELIWKPFLSSIKLNFIFLS
jgi:hypothetical protein